VIAIACAGFKLPVLGNEFYLGINMDDGKAVAWVYLVYSASKDTVVGVWYIRAAGTCTQPPFKDPGDALDPADFSRAPVPSSFLEGSQLVGKVKDNSIYNAFHTAYPDSVPTLVILSSSDEEVFGFPVGSPFWTFLWVSPGTGTDIPLTCVVHAITGETICFDDEILSVNGSEAQEAGFSVYPNPASSTVLLNMPPTLLGSHVRVEAVDMAGRRLVLTDGAATSVPLMLNTDMLSSGIWSLVVTEGTTQHYVPLAVVR
jgi:hypothetical protein